MRAFGIVFIRNFLADQLDASLDRLGLATLDVCLLHNPEYFCLKRCNEGKELGWNCERVLCTIERAFAYLESRWLLVASVGMGCRQTM